MGDDVSFTPECNFKSEPSTKTSTTKSSTTTKKTTTSKTTSSSTTTWHPPITTTTNLVTAEASDPHRNSAMIIGITFGVILAIIIIAVSIVTVRKRNLKVPGLEAVRGLINPGYNRRDDGGMVSLKELSSREN